MKFVFGQSLSNIYVVFFIYKVDVYRVALAVVQDDGSKVKGMVFTGSLVFSPEWVEMSRTKFQVRISIVSCLKRVFIFAINPYAWIFVL